MLAQRILKAVFIEPQQFSIMPGEGIEPSHSREYRILSPARLPISPPRLGVNTNIELFTKI